MKISQKIQIKQQIVLLQVENQKQNMLKVFESFQKDIFEQLTDLNVYYNT